MGLKQEMQKDIADEFDNDLADSIKKLQLIVSISIYNTDSGTNVVSEKVYQTRGMISGYTAKEIGVANGAIKEGYFKCIILENEISIVPKIDSIINENGTRYLIKKMNADALNVAYHIDMEKI